MAGALRTDVVLAMHAGVVLLHSRGQRGEWSSLGMTLAAGCAHAILAGVLIRNTILSSAILPAQLMTVCVALHLCSVQLRARLQPAWL
jgi:hypothetical protein